MKVLCTDDEEEFISIKLKIFYKKRNITFKYVVLYIHKENGLIKRKW